MVATSYIHRQGGLGSPHLCKLTHELGVGVSTQLISLKLIKKTIASYLRSRHSLQSPNSQPCFGSLFWEVT